MPHKLILEKILKHALQLNKYGLDELGWTQQDAINLIENLMEEEIGILGGDVYILNEEFLEALSENWYCKPFDDENREHYYVRSKKSALEYIKDFPVSREEKCIFSIIFTEKISYNDDCDQ